MKLQHVEAIVAIASEGSISAASKRLGKTQPALTKVLKQAEQDLGLSLFRRTARGMVPSDLGAPILERMKAINADIDRLDEHVEQLRGGLTGKISVAISPLAALNIMPRALLLFRKTHPFVEVHLSSGLYPSALGPLRNGQIDLVIGPTPPPNFKIGLNVEPLLSTKIVLLTAKGSKYAQATRLSELQDAEWIMIGGPGGPGDHSSQAFEENGMTPPKIVTTSESYFGAVSLVENLGAVCGFPERMLTEVQNSWNVTPIAIQETLAVREVSLISREGHPATMATEVLINCVRRVATSMEKRAK